MLLKLKLRYSDRDLIYGILFGIHPLYIQEIERERDREKMETMVLC